jgi:hypothetical protein
MTRSRTVRNVGATPDWRFLNDKALVEISLMNGSTSRPR